MASNSKVYYEILDLQDFVIGDEHGHAIFKRDMLQNKLNELGQQGFGPVTVLNDRYMILDRFEY